MWERRSIESIAAPTRWAVNGGPFGSKLTTRDYVEAGVPVIRGVNLAGDSRFNPDEFVFVSSEKAEDLRANLARPGDVVVTQRGTLGQVGLVPNGIGYDQFVVSQSQMKVTPDPERVVPGFLYYSLRSPDNVRRIQDLALVAGVPHINLAIFREFEIALPPLAVQEQVVQILSAFDDLIDNNNSRIEILEGMAQAIYRAWFVEFRYPGHEDVPLVESDLGPIPEGWEVQPLGSIVRSQYGYTESTQSDPVGPRFLRGMDFNKRPYIDWSQVPFCPISDTDFEKYRLRPGDIVVIRMADPGKPAIVEKDLDAVFASYLVRLTPGADRITPYFLFYFLSSPRYQDYISGASTGTTRKSASAGVLTGLEVIIPPREVLAHFEQMVQPMRRLLNVSVEQNAVLRTTRDLLLPKLVSGEIDVSDLELDVGEVP